MSLVPGNYALLNPGPVGTSVAEPSGSVTLLPVYLPRAQPITELWVNCTMAAAGSSCQFGYYTNVGGAFTLGVNFGTAATATTGVKLLPGSWTLPAGVIWLAWMNLGGSPAFRGTTVSPPAIPGPVSAWNGLTAPDTELRLLVGPSGQSALPATFTATAGLNANGIPVRFAVKVP